MPLSAIGAEHALEPQNRAIKVLGGIKGIANSQTALDEYFMIAEELSLLLDQFSDQYDLSQQFSEKEAALSTIWKQEPNNY